MLEIRIVHTSRHHFRYVSTSKYPSTGVDGKFPPFIVFKPLRLLNMLATVFDVPRSSFVRCPFIPEQ